jgi:hypothetical protein
VDAKLEKDALLFTAQGAASALEAAMRTADDCVGLHGGSGFIRDLVAEKLMRDAKQLALSCPTAEQLDQLAAAIEIGAALDPALVLLRRRRRSSPDPGHGRSRHERFRPLQEAAGAHEGPGLALRHRPMSLR